MCAEMTQDYSSCFEQDYRRFIAATYGVDKLLAAACRYALEGQGKRIRPLLVLLTCEAFGGDWRAAMEPAIAVEMVHTYSLVHDDLPCMDNDDLRRGRPTVHRRFDEATALLVGDTVFCDACALLAGSMQTSWQGNVVSRYSAEQRLQMVQVLTRYSGSQGLVLGQVQDLSSTGAGSPLLTVEQALDTYRKKSGSLIAVACALGAISAGAASNEISVMSRFGELLGSAFQIVDDLLDESSTSGKTPGKDRQQEKKTLVSLLDVTAARQLAATCTAQALELIAPHAGVGRLREFAYMLLARQQ